MSHSQILPRIFIFWTGSNELSINRIKAIDSIKNVTGIHVIFITTNNLQEWIVKDYPLHPAYEYLSLVHKADYLRCYFMHHYGGGYADIKCQTGCWINNFLMLNTNFDILAIGYREVKGGTAIIDDKLLSQEMVNNYLELIGNCAYIFRSKTVLTQRWYDNLHQKLDEKLAQLRLYPALQPRDYFGLWLGDKYSQYPFEWTEILGQIFHPLVYEYRDKILKSLPTPIFADYL